MRDTYQIRRIEPCTLTYGVDLSTNPRKTGLVAIRWGGGTPGLVTEARVGATRDELIEGIARSDEEKAVWAVDVPFGWPDGFSEFLTRHRNGPTALAPGEGSPGTPWTGIAFRETDRAARKDGAGINVSFDKLGATAAAWSVVEYGLQQLTRIDLDRSGLTGRVVETWPTAAWRNWDFDSRPASKAAWEATRERLVGERVIYVGEHEQALSGSEHIRDALACALVARARALGLTLGPSSNVVDRARREGWIHLPRPRTLGELAG